MLSLNSSSDKKLLEEGEATFEVLKIFDKDKDGNALLTNEGLPKINIMFLVIDKNNYRASLYESFSERTKWKLENLCKGIGKPELYTDPFDYNKLIGTNGSCIIETQNKPPYKIKSVIKKFIFKKPKAADEVVDYPDDECPF